ncbi:MAG: DUF4411 family protein [Pseudomonadota bacterium]|nr:DUF4411 family protein [Pseudomonadota bacterium]MED5236046.1 DUF4411 family protein [Pseudomonadota bacterium]
MDANTFIEAKELYYPFDIVPEYWDWLVYQGSLQNLKVPVEIYTEINGANQDKKYHDELAKWARTEDVKSNLMLDEELDYGLVNTVITQGYVASPTEADLLKMGRDPFLIAYALTDPQNITVVTTEASKPTKKGANRHVPDVCKHFGVQCCNTFSLVRSLGFSTNWKKSV